MSRKRTDIGICPYKSEAEKFVSNIFVAELLLEDEDVIERLQNTRSTITLVGQLAKKTAEPMISTVHDLLKK